MVGWHHQFNAHEFEQTLGDSEGLESLECCSPQGCKVSDMTEQLNDNKYEAIYRFKVCIRAQSVTSVMSNSLRPFRLWPAKLLCPWDSPGKNTVVGCHALLQRIFPTQQQNCVFCDSCISGGFFTAKPLGQVLVRLAFSLYVYWP